MEEQIGLGKLIMAQEVFERFRIDMINDRDKAGAVQAFACCYELACKTMARILLVHGLEVGSRKDMFRKAALEKIIDEPASWFEFLEKRSLMIHTHEKDFEEVIASTVSSFDNFSCQLQLFITRMGQMGY